MVRNQTKHVPATRILPRWTEISEIVARPKNDPAVYLRDGSELTLPPSDLHTILTWHLQDLGILPRG